MNNIMSQAAGTQQKPFSFWLKKNWYYHASIAQFYSWAVPANSRVLQIGCKTGTLLKAVKPSYGVGIESELDCLELAKQEFPSYRFYSSLDQIEQGELFDYIILSSTVMEIDDIQIILNQLKEHCHDRTRIVLDMYSFLWEPFLRIGQKMGMRRQTPLKNWLSLNDLENLLYLSGFEIITSGRKLLFPFYIPVFSWILNTLFSHIPFINRLCLMEWVVARPVASQIEKKPMVSVIVPCRNERGNVELIVKTLPQLGEKTEIIFIEGHSKDGTLDEIKRVAEFYPEKNIRFAVQQGNGKGDAVRLGFEMASGDILMIHDGDNTVPMHELHLFIHALVSGKGEMINGSRFVYGMESGATRFLNIIANHAFSLGFSWLLGQKVKDTLCGTKVLFKRDYELIAQNRSYFGDFDPFGDFDLLFGAAKLHLKIVDIPVHYKARTYGQTQIRRFYHGILLAQMWLFALRKFKF
ncbi:MAG TPA: glycosyltransferase [Candidatus Babeliales bacterium]|nr:glycosyltransferase [Candidatus Babeliales bacterium]